MGPQLEFGYTQLANGVIEALAGAELTAAQFKLVFVILRKTYGECEREQDGSIMRDTDGSPIKRKEARISLAEFADVTGLSKSTIAEALNTLVEWNVINKVASPGGNASVYGYQKYHDKWRIPTGRKGNNLLRLSDLPDSTQLSTPPDSSSTTVHSTGQSTVRPTGHIKRKETKGEVPMENGGQDNLSGQSDSTELPTAGDNPGDNLPTEPPSMQELLSRYSDKQRITIAKYWGVMRRTRQNGKIAESVIRKWMDKWSGMPPEAVTEGMDIHCDRYPGKREEYTHGIIRRLIKEGNHGGERPGGPNERPATDGPARGWTGKPGGPAGPHKVAVDQRLRDRFEFKE